MSEKKYNLKLSAMWQTKSGQMYMSMPVDDQVFDALQSVEKGGKLVVKLIDESRRTSDKSPHAYLEYISKEDVAAFAASRPPSRPAKPAKSEDDSDSI